MELSDWPAAARALLEWYGREGRKLPWRENPTPYRVLVSEIMLQQTRVETVIPYYTRFLAAFPDFAALADADEDRLMGLWQGLGYYSRARNLRRAAGQVIRDFGGSIPPDLAAIRSLCGVGDYTAGAVAAFAFGIPAPAVDGNVSRVIARLYADEDAQSGTAARKRAAERLAPVIPAENPGDFGQAMIELGALVCLPKNPRCEGCPLAPFCAGRAKENPTAYPPPAPKKPKKELEMTVLQITDGDRIFLRRRPPKGLLAGLWELPWLSGYPDEGGILAALRSMGLDPLQIRRLPDADAVFTHRIWHMRGYFVRVADPNPPPSSEPGSPGSPGFHPLAEIGRETAVPSAFAPFLPQTGAQDGRRSGHS